MTTNGWKLLKYSDIPCSPKKGAWGNWTFDEDRVVLVFRKNPGEYEVDLENITTASALCDWIFQVHMHGYDVADFVAAVDELIYPQATLCSGCCTSKAQSTKRLDVAEYLKHAKPA